MKNKKRIQNQQFAVNNLKTAQGNGFMSQFSKSERKRMGLGVFKMTLNRFEFENGNNTI